MTVLRKAARKLRYILVDAVYFLQLLLNGQLHVCERCAKLRQCEVLGKQMRRHWAMVMSNSDALEVAEPFNSMYFCLACEYEISSQLELHAECCGASNYPCKTEDYN